MALALFIPRAQAAGALGGWSAEAGFALDLPPGWSVVRETPRCGATLRPPDARPGAVDLVVWRVSVGVVNVQGAATEHERLLGADMPYERLLSEPIQTRGAGEGLCVEGSAELPDGQRAASVFAVFLVGNRAYVVGTFADPSQLAAARRNLIDPIVGGLSLVPESAGPGLLAEVGPVSAPEPPDGATVPLSPPPGTGVRPADVQPADRDEGKESAWKSYEDPAGFSLDVPHGWSCEVHESVVRVSSADGAAVYLLPVLCTGADVGKVTAEGMVALALSRAGATKIVACRECGRTGRCVWVWAAVGADEGSVSGPFALVVDEPVGLLAGVMSPDGKAEEALRTGARIVASFRARFGGSVEQPGFTEASWTDPSGVLQCKPPEGWRLDGGVLTYDKAPAISLQGTRVGGSPAWFVWSQPIRPIFRDLTDAMRGLGFRDGDPYYAYDGVDRRMVLTRGAPSDVVERYLLAEKLLPGTSPRIVGEDTGGAGLNLLGPGDERSAVVSLIDSSGLRLEQAWCAVSQRTTEPSRGGWFWEAACLGFGGSPGEGLTAARALAATIRSARIGPEGDSAVTAPLQALIAQSTVVQTSLPWQHLLGQAAAVPAHLVAEGAPEGRQAYSVPDVASELWRNVAAGVVEPCKGAGMAARRAEAGG